MKISRREWVRLTFSSTMYQHILEKKTYFKTVSLYQSSLLLRPKKDPRKDTKILPKKLIFGAKNAKDIFNAIGFFFRLSNDWQKSPVQYWFIKTKTQIFIQKWWRWLNLKVLSNTEINCWISFGILKWQIVFNLQVCF